MKIALDNGPEITLVRLNQHLTYDGLLIGIPRRGLNKHLVSAALQDAQREFGGFKPFEIEPVESITDEADDRHPFGVAATIPSVTCIALFTAFLPAHDRNKDYSLLPIV